MRPFCTACAAQVGDGAAPRTATLACFLTKWQCASIDPLLRDEWRGAEPRGVKRLFGFQGTLDEFMASDASLETRGPVDRLVVLCVHTHARFVGPSAVDRVRARYGDPETCVVALPCCARVRPERDMGRKPDTAYRDDCVFSEKRKVQVWRFGAGPTPPPCPVPGAFAGA